ncbi:uncharacterized protein LOC144864875 [Branchiostoma floridae x Branchiostoma japonicum]
MVGITSTTYWALCPIILLWIGSASARFQRGICPPGKDGSSSDHTINLLGIKSIRPVLGQSQELRCDFPDLQSPVWNHDLGVGVKLLWFKDNEQVSNTSDGRITITEDVVNVPDNISHLCLSWFPKSFLSILSIHNIEESDYGVYNCYLVINNEYESTSVLPLPREGAIHLTTLKGPDDVVWPKTLPPKLTNKCRTTLTCVVFCFDCCPCDTGLCEMMLLKDNKMVTSTTSVVTNRQRFTSTLKISIDGPEDFGRYDCVLKQLVIDCVDGSMVENLRRGSSFDLLQPAAYATRPHRAFTNAEGAHVSCLFEKWSLLFLTVSKQKMWEVVLRKDGKEISSKETTVSPVGTVQESFSLKRTLEVYGRYECVIRQTHHGCMNQSWFDEGLSQITGYHSSLNLQLHTVPAWLWETVEHTCGFLVERIEMPMDRYAIAVALHGNQVLRQDVDSIASYDDGGNIVSANFEIEVKDPTSFGIYDCILEKDGLPDPSAKDITAESHYVYRGLYFHNTFQITPNTIWRPGIGSNRLQVKLGSSVYLPCHSPEDVLTSTDEISQLSWYRNGVQIRDDDNYATLISQRFWDEKQLVSFLWCIVNTDNVEAFGTFECRSKDDIKVSTAPSEALQSFSIEPHNWTEQANDLFKRLTTDRKTYEDRFRLYADGIRVRDNALSEASKVVAILLVALVFVTAGPWIKQKFLERDIRVTLENIQQMERSSEGSHHYDVFISYSSEDASWAREDLLRNLESTGYTVCLDTRDFPAGKPILTNIATAIYQSRKVILVMSKNFIKSGWCMHELALTFQRKLDQRENCVVVVKYDDCKIPRGLAMRTYLDWTEPMARERLWANLHEWLGPPSQPLDLGIEDKKEKLEVLAIEDSNGGVPTDSLERDDVVLRQRQIIPSNGSD